MSREPVRLVPVERDAAFVRHLVHRLPKEKEYPFHATTEMLGALERSIEAALRPDSRRRDGSRG